MEERKSESREPKSGNEVPIPTAASSSSAPPPPPWIELPEDLTANILQRLGAEEILESAQKVCTTWWRVCKDPATWRVIDLRNRHYVDDEFLHMCRCAVDRSQGQLIDLKVACCEEDGLLNYVAERSSQLQRLTLSEFDITGTTLVEAIKKLPQLEELHLIMMPSLDPRDIETIGISCPMLKSFTYNEHWIEHPEYSEDEELNERYHIEYAVVIGKTMPNLLHLRLFAHRMKNEGLEAILDGCPLLESLDLRRCSGLDLQGALGKRCSEQIKDLRLPSDSISDIDWLPLIQSSESDYDWDDNGSPNSGKSNFSDFFYGDFDDSVYDYDCYDGIDGYDYF